MNIILFLTPYYRNFVMDIHTKTGQIMNKGSGTVQQVAGQPTGAGYDLSKPVQVRRGKKPTVLNKY